MMPFVSYTSFRINEMTSLKRENCYLLGSEIQMSLRESVIQHFKIKMSYGLVVPSADLVFSFQIFSSDLFLHDFPKLILQSIPSNSMQQVLAEEGERYFALAEVSPGAQHHGDIQMPCGPSLPTGGFTTQRCPSLCNIPLS